MFGILVVLAATCLLAGAAWRLSQGPIDLDWMADRARQAFVNDTGPLRVRFDHLAMAWEGFDKGVDYPIDLRVLGVSITDPSGRPLAAAPNAHMTLSLAGLLMGRIVPRSFEVDGARLSVTREADGTIALLQPPDPASSPADELDLRQLAQQLTRPASSDHGQSRDLLDQVRRVHFRNAHLLLHDRPSGLALQASDADLNLARRHSGRIQGMLAASLTLGGAQSRLTVEVDLLPGRGGNVSAGLTAFRPAAVSPLPASLAFLGQFDLPLSLSANASFDTSFGLRHMGIGAQTGPGQIQIQQSKVPLRHGVLEVAGTPADLTITRASFDFAHAPDSPAETVDLGGSVTRRAGRIAAAVRIDLGQLNIADLPLLWPRGVAEGPRSWVTQHVTGGRTTHGTASLVVEASDALNDAALVKATGDLDATAATFTWLDDIPPIEQAEAHLHLADPDTLDIHIATGRQRVGNHAVGLTVRDGQMRITGLTQADQVADITTGVDGPVTSALGLLSEPRLHLLSTHPIGLKVAAGDATSAIRLRFPLTVNLPIDDVQIHADAHLTHVRLPEVAMKHELTDGAFDLAVDKDGLTFKGTGTLADAPAKINGWMGFNQVTADQVVQKVTVTGQPDAAQFPAFGLPVKDILDGKVGLTVVQLQRRNGDGSVAFDADLTQAAFKLTPLAWSKPPGVPASAIATLQISHDQPTRIDHIALLGNGLGVNGSAGFTDGRLRSVSLDRIQVGRTEGHGTIRLDPHGEVGIVLQGPRIDMAAKLTEKTPAAPPAEPTSTPRWRLDARFDQALLANDEIARNVLAHAAGAGDALASLDAVAATQDGDSFSFRLQRQAAGRHLSVTAKDAGRLLRGLDVIRTIKSGHLLIEADLDSPTRFYPLHGTLAIDNAVLRNSPLVGKLLQAITLYGLVDVLRGPGMAFSDIVIPFRYDGHALQLDDAHASNPSLGITATGGIALASGQTAINGTIVPAYFFNSMLGQLPLVGKFFSPEKGGGVFAARFAVAGSIDNPSVSVNPISALTPGFLRQIFNIFDTPGLNASAVPVAPP